MGGTNVYNNCNSTLDVLHLLNGVLLTDGITLALARTGIGKLNARGPEQLQ